jgi:TPR repeat protein
MCYNGEGVPKDYAASAGWIKKAAEAGDAGAQQSLGDIYKYGTRMRVTTVASVNRHFNRDPDWMPITPKAGSLFHADSQIAHSEYGAKINPPSCQGAFSPRGSW